MGTWFSVIQIKKTLLQIHTFYITTNLSKQCRLAGLHELATVDILYVHINFCSIVLAPYPSSWVQASIVYPLLQMYNTQFFVAHNFVSLYSIHYVVLQ